MRIEITGAYDKGIYFDVITDKGIMHAYGFEDIKKLIDDARAKGEQIEFRGRKTIYDCIKLNRLLKKK